MGFIMLKKFLSVIFILLFMNLIIGGAYAENTNNFKDIHAEFLTELDVNKASKEQIVQFKSSKDAEVLKGVIIPKGTIFTGRIKSFKRARWAYRRAKVHIEIDNLLHKIDIRITKRG